jgi:phospholipid-binding lipoprotein MlaA
MVLATAAAAQEAASPPVVVPAPGPSAASPVVSTGDAARARRARTKGDPLEGANRKLFSIHQTLDRVFFRPIAMVYKTVIPKLVRTGVRHILSNLGEPIVFANDLLQLKPHHAARTLARFAINSTVGIGGVIDVAKSKLPHRDNGFGNTLGRYGVGPGPYIFVPLIGPTDLRDLFGGQVDGATLPLAIGFPFDRAEYQIPRAVVSGLDQRVEADAELKSLLNGAADPYATLRSVYLQSRAGEIDEIRHGTAGTGALDDPLTDPEATPGGTASPSVPPKATDTPADPEATPPAAPSAQPGTIDTPADPEPAPADPGTAPPAPTPDAADSAKSKAPTAP